ncbi:MAG: CHASE domain-containing protein, partial [Acidimicrobiia bacterium]|nr:CHASE domain-containing protein [Acidimicrobiia bacterium]
MKRGRRSLERSETSRLREWLPALAAFVVVAGSSFGASVAVHRAAERQIESRLALQSEALTHAISEGVEDVVVELSALVGLFQASDHVNAAEYGRYVSDFGLEAGMGGLAFVPVVDADGLDAFAQQMAATVPDYEMFEIDLGGHRVPVGPREWYFPIQFFEPADSFDRPLGLDVGSPPGRIAFLMKAVRTGRPVATPLVSLLPTGQEGFVLYSPLVDDLGIVEALVVSPVVLADLIEGRVPGGLASELDWTVRDVTAYANRVDLALDAHGQLPPSRIEGLVHSDIITVADRVWQFDVTPSVGSSLLSDGLKPSWIFLIGLAMAMMAGATAHAASRRVAAVRQVAVMAEVLAAKDQFVASMSHELRTPLTGILGFAEILRDQPEGLSLDERVEMVEVIAEQATELSAIIEDLLVTARTEHGTLMMVEVPVDMADQIAHVLESLNCTDRVPIEANSIPKAVGDPGRVRQVVRNLVVNALAYGGSSIRVVVEPIGGMFAVHVIDDGVGVPIELSEKIFEPYFSAHTKAGLPVSIGLGLSVSRDLARRMAGDLTHSREDGETIFRFTLPIAPAESDHPQVGSTSSQRDARLLGSNVEPSPDNLVDA